MSDQPSASRFDLLWRVLEFALVVFGAGSALFIAITFISGPLAAGLKVRSFADLFPLIYLLEIVLVSTAALVGVVINRSARPTWASALYWAAGGIFLAFGLLAAFSFGPFMFPAMLSLLGAGVFADLRQGGGFFRHAGLFLLAGLLQAVLTFILLILGA